MHSSDARQDSRHRALPRTGPHRAEHSTVSRRARPGAPPRGEAASLELAAASDIGLRRTINEDSYVVLDLSMAAPCTSRAVHRQGEARNERARAVLMVADGVGGGGDGDAASAAVVQFMSQYASQILPALIRSHGDNPRRLGRELTMVLRHVHQRLAEAARDGGLSPRMASTLTLVYVTWPVAYVVHAGDSRCYRLRRGALEQITSDHTIASRMVRCGLMEPGDAISGPYAHLLYNCLGGSGNVFADVHRLTLRPGDQLLLCTDGLSSYVPQERIAEILASSDTAQRAGDRLVEAANEAGGRDNVTVALCRVHR